jgi:hypothetical protein
LGSLVSPIFAVPTGWKIVVPMSPAALRSAASSSLSLLAGKRLDRIELLQRRLRHDRARDADRVGGDAAVRLAAR